MEKENNRFGWLTSKPFAHRGLTSEQAPENSLIAFSEAVKCGYGIELDVQLTSDDEVVVFHDERLSRMTGIDGYVASSSYAGLKNLKLLKTEAGIPLLSEALEKINGKTPVLIEIKNKSNKHLLEKAVYEIVKNYKGDFAIISNNASTLEWYKLNAPHIKRGQHGGSFKNFVGYTLKQRLALRSLKTCKTSDPNFILYDVQDLPSRYLRKYKDLPNITWTVKTAEQLVVAEKYADNYIFENVRP